MERRSNMPYITQADRERMASDINSLSHSISTVGELNYDVTQLCRRFLINSQGKYADYNAIVGTLECAKLEFYRRAVAAYEDKKIAEQGDVY